MNPSHDFNATETEIHDDLQAYHHASFALVENKADWKAPIDAFITTDEVRKVVDAVTFFTGAPCTVEYIGWIGEEITVEDWKRFKVGDHVCRIKSVGYRGGPCGI